LKPVVNTYELRQAIRDARDFPLVPDQPGLGGAAAIIAETLAQLGIDACVYSMYHSEDQASRFDSRIGTQWLSLTANGPAYSQACQSGQRDHPTRWTYALAYPQGLTLQSRNVSAQRTDRTLLVMRPYCGSLPVASFEVQNAAGATISRDSLRSPEWKSLAGFVTWSSGGASGSDLEIRFSPAPVVADLGRHYHYGILNAPGLGQLQNPSDRETQALLEQVRELKNAGVSLHMEISGGADPARHTIAPFTAALGGLVQSMGINDEELAQIAQTPGYPRRGISRPPVSSTLDIYQRYVHALRLAETLGLERLYVHATDVDLVLRKGVSEAALQQEVQATLFTKGAVIVSILLRNGRDPRTYPLPAALYHEGFRRLIELAWQFSRQRFPGRQQSVVTQRKDLFQQIVKTGYYLAQGKAEYSVAIVPVMWPEALQLQPDLNTTGAGDICSGVSLLYSGWP
jgi:hypothetical protein